MDTNTENEFGWTSLDEIAAKVRACVKCRLSETRTNAVPGDGSSAASVLFIGEGPGKNEDEQGLPFIGRAGQLLNKVLSEAPLAREDVYITNVVKCRPPGNRDPEQDEVAACMPYLKAQISLLDPRVIVTLGRHSMLRFYPEGKISKDHGRIINIGDRVLLPLYHPAAALRNPSLVETLRDDIRRIPEAVRQSLQLSVASANRNEADSENLDRNSTSLSASQGGNEPSDPKNEDEDRNQMNLF